MNDVFAMDREMYGKFKSTADAFAQIIDVMVDAPESAVVGACYQATTAFVSLMAEAGYDQAAAKGCADRLRKAVGAEDE